jgi:hypothetical protein
MGAVRALLLLAVCLVAVVTRADDSGRSAAMKAIATSDVTEVHPDAVFEVTLSLQNMTDTTLKIRIPESGWDRVWKSSNHRVSWDALDSDDRSEITIEIAPHDTYVFPKTLKMFVDESFKQSRIDFKMGFKPAAFGKVVWSDPISLDVTP